MAVNVLTNYMFRPIHGHHQFDCLKYPLCNKLHCVCGTCYIVDTYDNQPDDGHELTEICRWLISRIYILFISSCVIHYFQHI